MKSSLQTRQLIVLMLGFGVTLTACKKKSSADDSDDAETTTVSGSGGGGSQAGDSSTVPQVGSISLSDLGAQEGAALADDPRACRQGNMGAMGLAFGSACAVSPLAARLMLGREDGDFDGDGDIDCNDFVQAKGEGKDVGLMLHLLCEDVMLKNDNVVSLAFADEAGTKSFAVGFTDFANDTTAAGSWTQGNAASYPADIRIWQGTTFDDFKGHVALGLTDVNNGKVYLDTAGQDGPDFQGVVSYSNKVATGDCLTSPSVDTCHNQDIRLYSGEGTVTQGPPNGFHLKIFADDKKLPTFIAIEGNFRYTAASAAAVWGSAGVTCPLNLLTNVRSIYFQAIQKGAQVWGHFAFRDANGALLDCTMPGGFQPFAMLASADGICQNRGSQEVVACSDIDPAAYSALWEGEDTFEAITESPVGDIWDGAPKERGVCTTTGCGTVQ